MTYPEPKEDRDAARRAEKLTTPTNHNGSFGPVTKIAARARKVKAQKQLADELAKGEAARLADIEAKVQRRKELGLSTVCTADELDATPMPRAFPPSAISVWGRLVESWRTYGRTLPTDSAFRKEFPIESGVNMYFPAALVCCAAWSKFNNNKHNPGEPLHHSRAKSGDHEECISRHSFDIADAVRRGDELTELEEATAVFWRAGARLQILCERLGAPLAPAARLPEGGSK